MPANTYDSIIYNKAVAMGMNPQLAKIIVAQARFETGDYLSPVFKNLNNAFGYKFVGQTKWPVGAGAAANDGGVYAKYANVADSTGELVDYLKRKEKSGGLVIEQLNTPEQYAAALKRLGYYGITAGQYSKGLTANLRDVKIAGGIGLLVLLAVGIYIYTRKQKK